MLYCRICGQCLHISDQNFIEFVPISGTETRYLDPDNGEVIDYGDNDYSANGDDSEIVCPHCDGTSIDMDWDGSEEEAKEQRKDYESELNRRATRRKTELYQTQTMESEWDLGENL